MEEILQEIRNERVRQNEKWGKETKDSDPWMAILTEEVGEVANATLGRSDWDLEAELIQVAAICVKWIEHIQGLTDELTLKEECK